MDLIDNPDGLFLNYEAANPDLYNNLDLTEMYSPSSSNSLSSPASALSSVSSAQLSSSTGTADNYYYSEHSPGHLNANSVGSSDSPCVAATDNHTIVLDDFFMEDWQNQNFGGGGGGVGELQANQGANALAVERIQNGEESDSGLSSTSSSNSPKTISSSDSAAQHDYTLVDSGNMNCAYFHQDGQDNYPLNFDLPGDLRDSSFDAILQSMDEKVEGADDIIELPEESDDTEALLNNIEMLLNSMQDLPDVESSLEQVTATIDTGAKRTTKAARQRQKITELQAQLLNKKQQQQGAVLIKQEPADVTSKGKIKKANESGIENETSSLFRKISPKAPNTKTILPKPLAANNAGNLVMSPSLATNQVPIQIATIPVQSVLTLPVQLQMPSVQSGSNATSAPMPATIIIKNSAGGGNDTTTVAPANLNFKPIQIVNGADATNGQQIIFATADASSAGLTTAVNETSNKKIKIESPVVKQPTPMAPAAQSTIILSPAIAQKPVASGQSPNITPKIQATPKTEESPVIKAPSNPIVPANANIDPSIIKKQSRMIKNRESACLSRKRKKEHLESLEENLKEMTQKYEAIKQENQSLRERVLVLEAENKVLREHQQQTIIRALPAANQSQILTKIPITSLNSIKTASGSMGKGGNVTTLKRPFIMLAVFLVFGINIFQFINVNSGNGPALPPSYPQLMSENDGPSAAFSDIQLAALAAAQARDGALIDSQNAALLKQHMNSRHLLSDVDYSSEEEDNSKSKVNISKLLESARKQFNITDIQMPSNESMELVKINGTWHLVDLNICYQMMLAASSGESSNDPKSNNYFNQTHVNRYFAVSGATMNSRALSEPEVSLNLRINNELNRWFERHLRGSSQSKGNQSRQPSKLPPNFQRSDDGLNSNSNKLRQMVRKQVSDRIIAANNKAGDSSSSTTTYPVSVYDTNVRAHEKFTESIRKRNDTFYYISFRRDHVIIPPVAQTNKTHRPRISLLMPALLKNDIHLNDSSKVKDDNMVAFMQIDCEVTDTRLLYLNKDDIPLDYLKILSLNDQITTVPGGSNTERPVTLSDMDDTL